MDFLSKEKDERPNVVQIEKGQFDRAKNGELVMLGAFRDADTDNFAVVVIGRDEMPAEEKKQVFAGVIASGDDIYYIPVREYEWEYLDNHHLDKIPMVFFGNVAILLTSRRAYQELMSNG